MLGVRVVVEDQAEISCLCGAQNNPGVGCYLVDPGAEWQRPR